MTKDQLKKWAIADYEEVLGKEIFVSEFSAYIDETSIDFNLPVPVKAKVVKTPELDIIHLNSEWLDPYWNIQILKIPESVLVKYPELEKITSPWMFGDSYSTDGKYQPARYDPHAGPREWTPRVPGNRPRPK